MRRSFQVATVFTGAAAAVAAFTPAAGAATPAPGATAKVTPDAVAKNCTGDLGNTMSLVLYYTNTKHAPACVAGTGKVAIGDGGATFNSYCGGFWSGYLWIKHAEHKFAPGTHKLYGQDVSAVTITKSDVANGAWCLG